MSNTNENEFTFSLTELVNSVKGGVFLSALGIALFVWILDPFIDAVVLHEGTFYQQLIQPNASERYGYSVWSTLTIILGLIGGFLLNRSRQAEKIVRESKARLIEAQRIAQIGSWELDLLSDSLYWSDEVYRIFDSNPRKFSPNYKAFLDIVHPDDRALVDQTYRDSVKNKTPYEIVHRLLVKDGKVKFVRERCETVFDELGRAVRSVGTVQDITERKQAENVLRESEERFRAIFEKAADSILLIDVDTAKILEFNDATHKNLGYARAEFQQIPISDIEAAESADEVSEHLNKLLEKGSDVFETKHRTKNGDLRDILVSAEIISLESRKVCISIWRDITERRLDDKALRASEQRYRILFEESPVPLWEEDFSCIKKYIDSLKQKRC